MIAGCKVPPWYLGALYTRRTAKHRNWKRSLWKEGRSVSEPVQLSLASTPQEKGGVSRLDVFLEALLSPNTSYLASYRSSRVKFKDL